MVGQGLGSTAHTRATMRRPLLPRPAPRLTCLASPLVAAAPRPQKRKPGERTGQQCSFACPCAPTLSSQVDPMRRGLHRGGDLCGAAGTTPLSVLPERDPGWPVPHPLQVQDPEGTDVCPAAHTLFCAGFSLLGDSPRAGRPGWEGPGDRIMGRAAGGLETARAERTGCRPASVHSCR